MSSLPTRLWRRANRPPRPRDSRFNPMRRSSDPRSWTGSPLSMAAPAMFPPSLLATFDEAAGILAVGTLLALVALGLLILTWRLVRGGARWWPAAAVVLASGVGFVAFWVLVFGFAAADCAPDAYECPV